MLFLNVAQRSALKNQDAGEFSAVFKEEEIRVCGNRFALSLRDNFRSSEETHGPPRDAPLPHTCCWVVACHGTHSTLGSP